MRHTLVVTLLTVLAAGVWLICYDVFLVWHYGVEQTISWQTYQAARSEPIIPLLLGLAVGILFGHLFWPQK
jgi:hypothetical protein